MTYKDVINEFKAADRRYALSDEYLAENASLTRADLPVCGEYSYGVVYTRDDAVDLLIARINELEQQLCN